jgi:hypothetical protein
MITYEKFKDIIVKYIRFRKVEDQLYKMGIDIAEGPLGETTGYYFDWLWEAYFNEDGCDTIAWWAFEYHDIENDFDNDGEYIGEKMEPGMWDKDENIIPMVTIKDLWEYVKDDRKEFVKDPKEQLKDTINEMVKTQIENAVEPADLDVIKEAVGDAWEKISKFFDDTDRLVCLDNTDEAIADIMSTYLDDKTPYIDEQLEQCHVEIFLDTNVGTLLVLSAEDFELYVWQG